MRRVPIACLMFLAAAAPAAAGAPAPTLTGDYAEVRTAEVFTGGCIMNSEAETLGREAVMAWRIAHGTFDDVRLDGLSVVAVLAGDRNLGMREMGGEAPTRVRMALVVDERATPAQRAALIALARQATEGLVGDIARVDEAPIRFDRSGRFVEVEAADATFRVDTEVPHDPGCGAMLWFQPLSAGADAAVGLTESQAYRGDALGKRWRQAGKRSAFVGTFTF